MGFNSVFEGLIAETRRTFQAFNFCYVHMTVSMNNTRNVLTV